MILQQALTLQDATLPVVQVSATVVVSILSSYQRRSQAEGRVIGTLLGEVKGDGSVTVSDFVHNITAAPAKNQYALQLLTSLVGHAVNLCGSTSDHRMLRCAVFRASGGAVRGHQPGLSQANVRFPQAKQ